MKKSIKLLSFLIVILSSFVHSSKAQTYWRRLTLTNNVGISPSGSAFNQTSANLTYELKKNYTINSWTGMHYQVSPDVRWFSSQSTVTKRYGQFNIGMGVQFGAAGINIPTYTYGIGTMSYTFKL